MLQRLISPNELFMFEKYCNCGSTNILVFYQGVLGIFFKTQNVFINVPTLRTIHPEIPTGEQKPHFVLVDNQQYRTK